MKTRKELIEKIISCCVENKTEGPPLFTVCLHKVRSETPPFPNLIGFSHLSAADYYSEKLSLASSDGQYLLRIINDPIHHQLQAHLLHREKSSYQYVFICPRDQARCYLTDSHGLVLLEDLELSDPSIKIMPPAAIFEFSPPETKQTAFLKPAWCIESLKDSALEVEIFRQERDLTIKVKFLNPNSALKLKKMVLAKEEEEPLIATTFKNMALFEVPARFINSEKVQINIYG